MMYVYICYPPPEIHLFMLYQRHAWSKSLHTSIWYAVSRCRWISCKDRKKMKEGCLLLREATWIVAADMHAHFTPCRLSAWTDAAKRHTWPKLLHTSSKHAMTLVMLSFVSRCWQLALECATLLVCGSIMLWCKETDVEDMHVADHCGNVLKEGSRLSWTGTWPSKILFTKVWSAGTGCEGGSPCPPASASTITARFLPRRRYPTLESPWFQHKCRSRYCCYNRDG